MKKAFVFLVIIAVLAVYIIPATIGTNTTEQTPQFGSELVFADELYGLEFNVEKKCLETFNVSMESSAEGETAKYILTALTDQGLSRYFEYSLRPNDSVSEEAANQFGLVLSAGEYTLLGQQVSERTIQNDCTLQDVKVKYLTTPEDI